MTMTQLQVDQVKQQAWISANGMISKTLQLVR